MRTRRRESYVSSDRRRKRPLPGKAPYRDAVPTILAIFATFVVPPSPRLIPAGERPDTLPARRQSSSQGIAEGAMAAFVSTLMLSSALAGIHSAPPKRRPGRPRTKPVPSILTAPPRNPRGRPRQYERKEVLRVITEWKERAQAEGRTIRSDARAIAELLYHHARADTRRQMDRRLALHRENSETVLSEWRALRQAVIDVEGPRFRTLCDLIADAWPRQPKPHRQK
jgi:hypothetical protein